MSCMIHYWSITCHALGYLTPVTYLSYLRWIVTNHQSPHIHSCFGWTVTNQSSVMSCILNKQSTVTPCIVHHQSITHHTLHYLSPINHQPCLVWCVTYCPLPVMPCSSFHQSSITYHALYDVLQINHLLCLVSCVTNQSPIMPCEICHLLSFT